jgi:hypothetical protein
LIDRSRWPNTQVVGLWWLLIPLTTAPLDDWVDAWWGNDAGRLVFYAIRGLAIFLLPELFPAITRTMWPIRLVIGGLLGLVIGGLAAKVTFLIIPVERARALNTLATLDLITQVHGSIFFSFVTGGWLVGAVYFTFGRFRGSPWRKGKESNTPGAA